MKLLTEEWLTKAEGDLQVADAQMQGGSPVLDVVCFLCQQAVEKYLKTWLTEQSIAFPRTHDLEARGKLCQPSLPEIANFVHDLRYLTTFGVEVRYPGTSASVGDAQQALNTGHRVRLLVRSELGIR